MNAWDDADMCEAWAAGARWVADRVEIDDGELYVPEDDAGVEGRDWAEAAGSWLADYEMDLDTPRYPQSTSPSEVDG